MPQQRTLQACLGNGAATTGTDPATNVALRVDLTEKFQESVETDRVPSEIQAAILHCQSLAATGTWTARGRACPIRDPQEVQKLALAASGNTGTLFSGSLGQLDLQAVAVHGSVDVGKCAALLGRFATAQDVVNAIGIIIINADLWKSPAAEGLVRAHKDAEVFAACLTIYWHKDAPAEVREALQLALADLTYEARCLGVGSTFGCAKLKLLDREEEDRDVSGASAFRRCLYLAELQQDLQREGRFADVKSDAEMMLKLFKEEQVKLNGCARNWNTDTLRRYLAVGRRLAIPEVKKLMMQWEYLEKRGGILDGVTILRAVIQATSSDAEVLYIVQTLFMEQRCKLRDQRSVACRTPGLLMKAVLLRRNLLLHLRATFPEFASTLDEALSLQLHA